MIELRDVRKTYRRGQETILACHVDSLSIENGEQVALCGPSGCGKTTLLHVISGLLAPDGGTVRVGDLDIFDLGEAERDRWRARNVGYVHQIFNLLAPFTALENVALGAYFAGAGDQKGRARELLERVGLGPRLQHRPAQLSVGQQQRVAVARALVNRPAMLLADEPTGNQDPKTGRQTLALIRELAAEIGTTVLVVTHDPESAAVMERTIELPELAPAGAAP